jgi:DNA polymerase elongation subunit (family B)
MYTLFVYSWFYTDYTVYGHCLDKEGGYHLLSVRGFYPSCYVEIEPDDRVLNATSVAIVKVEQVDMNSSRDIYAVLPCCRIYFENAKQMEIFVSEIRKYGKKIHMADIPQIIMFLSQKDLDHVGWVDIDIDINIDRDDIHIDTIRPSETMFVPYNHPKVMSFDIEVKSVDSGMPQPHRLNDTVEMISVVVFTIEGTNKNTNTNKNINTNTNTNTDTNTNINTNTFMIHAYEHPLNIENCVDIVCKDENNIIIEFFKLIEKEDPTILTGFNIYGFDLHYLVSRLQLRLTEIPDISRGLPGNIDLIRVDWTSDAYGHNNYNRLVIGGRLIIDMYLYFKRMKLDKYSLDFISNKFLNERKNDMPHEQMVEAFKSRNFEALRTVAKYCIQDSMLVMKLFEKVRMWIDACEIAKITRCGIEDIYTRGEQMKLVSQCVKECMKRRILLQSHYTSEWKQYEGAYVLEPEKGLYEGCSVVDFQSLYPSIIIAYNICPSTYVRSSSYPLAISQYHEICVVSAEKFKSGVYHYFRKKPIGLLPGMIKSILDERKYVKEKMTTMDNTSVDYIVFHRRQNALKICANSVYGMMGFKNSRYFGHVECAESVTTVGRQLLSSIVTKVENDYPVKVIYGDSVTGYTPTIVRILKEFVFIEKLENLAEMWGQSSWTKCTESGKESCELYNVEVWTDNGWTKCYRVIRHILQPNKKIIRVLTHTGLVDVTDEHSLLDVDSNIIDVNDVNTNSKLLHHQYPALSETEIGISSEEARILGMFCGDGSTGTYDCSSGRKTSWAINNANIVLLLKYKYLCEHVYHNYTWIILDTIESSNVYKLVPKGNVAILSMYYRLTIYNNHEKIVPHKIINSSKETRQAFWDGLYDADGDKAGQRIDQKNQVSIASFAILASSLGYNISLNTRLDKPDIFRLTITKYKQRKDPFVVKKKYEIEYAGYVYDLTTENNRFQAGPGNMIVHNTDSCMLWHDSDDRNEILTLGKQICDDVTAALPKPMALKFESYCEKIMLLTKKRYVLVSDGKVSYKGVMNARRDYCKYAKDTYSGVIQLVATGKKEDILDYIDTKIVQLLSGACDISDLIVTKSIGRKLSTYKVNQPHVVLARRLSEKAGVDIPAGTRLEYVFTKTGRMSTISEVEEDQLEIDCMFYVNKQLATQIDDVLSAIGMENYIKNTWC